MNKNDKIYIAGHKGMVGSAIHRKLKAEGFTNIVTRKSSALDLRDQQAVAAFFEQEQPDYVFLAAAKVGGIQANNTYRADFIYENIMIEANVIQQAHLHNVKKLLFLGSSCIYPKHAPQPMKEDDLLSGKLEYTNEPYAIAKIAGIKMCENFREQYGNNFISVMPANLYGPNDNYDLETSHVLPALIRKFHEAKINNKPEVEIWGTGKPMREFLHVEDMADACYFLMENYNDKQFVNIGTGKDVSIREMAEIIREVTGYKGKLTFNTNKPEGTPRKLMDVSKLHSLGWKHQIELKEGIEKTYKDFMENYSKYVSHDQ